MIRITEVHRLLERASYKPGTTFRADRIDRHDVLIHVSQRVQDVRPPNGTTFVRSSYKLDESELRSMNEHQFYQRLYEEILRQEEHELREWFVVGDHAFIDPHPEVWRNVRWDKNGRRAAMSAAAKDTTFPKPMFPYQEAEIADFFREQVTKVEYKALLGAKVVPPQAPFTGLDLTSQEDADDD